MPCFKGIAVSVHATGAPLPEYSIQKQSRVSRVNAYIPVPQPRVPKDSTSNKPEPSTFAISITLLTPGIAIPYSTPKATPENPHPQPQIVGDGHGHSVVDPYKPLTNSENETIAAYIYFDGRPKEEVATLLRPGEETWVNSRWVQIPESEGGGLAEREFLFREVGLERWLNGLDLDGGKDAAAKLERRRKKFEKHRQRKIKTENGDMDMSGVKKEEDEKEKKDHVLRYGDDSVEKLSDDEVLSDWSSDDDAPPEAAGQIKVAMFRVLASGEIKRGEYSPQFDAHDDDDGEKGENGGASEADIDHTTSFAKPKTLDPKSISTQTVTGIDGPDKPYAVFTFFYRGERQLHKMGILDTTKNDKTKTTPATKRTSTQMDFSNLPALKTTGTVGFSAFRNADKAANPRRKSRKTANGSAIEDSDDDDDDDVNVVGKMEDVDDNKDIKTEIDADEAKFSNELADNINRIKLKRQHSNDPFGGARDSPSTSAPSGTDTPPNNNPLSALESSSTTGAINITNNMFGNTSLPNDSDSMIGSPMKKQRATTFSATPEEASQLLKDITAPSPLSGSVQNTSENSNPFGAPLGSTVGGSLPNQVVKEEAMDEEL